MPADLAIASITLALKQELQSALNRLSQLGAEVRTEKPDKLVDTSAPIVNVYLYQATINPFMRNDDLDPEIVRNPDGKTGELIQTWRVPLKLNYMISFYGDERALVPQRLMATCVAALHRMPVITRARAVAAGMAQSPDFDPASLEDFDDVDLVLTALTIDDIFRLWSVFKASYALSITYEATTAIVTAVPVPEPVDFIEAVGVHAAVQPRHGSRSVEVSVINNTSGDLTVTTPATQQIWIQGEQPRPGDKLDRLAATTYGVLTYDPLWNAIGSVEFTGLGASPLVLQFANPFVGPTTCTLTPNDAVTATVVQNPVDNALHSSWTVTLVDRSAPEG